MTAVQIVNSTWFMPGWIGIMIGMPIGVGIVLFTQWGMN